MTTTHAITKRETFHGNMGSLRLPKGIIIAIRPASNLAPDSRIKAWAIPAKGLRNLWPGDTAAWADEVGCGLHEGDYEPVPEALAKAANAARFIYEGGGCNPSGLCRSLVEAVDAGRASATGERQTDMAYAPARLIASQIAFLFGQGIGDYRLVDADRAVCKALTGPIKSLGDTEPDSRAEWIKGWTLWVRWGCREDCTTDAERAGFDAAAKANETGPRPTVAEAAEACSL